jgi:hypothetical protein
MPSSVDELITLLETVWGPMDPDTEAGWRMELNGKDRDVSAAALVALRDACSRTPSIALFRATYRGAENQRANQQRRQLEQHAHDGPVIDKAAWFAEQRAKLRLEA